MCRIAPNHLAVPLSDDLEPLSWILTTQTLANNTLIAVKGKDASCSAAINVRIHWSLFVVV